jgi:calcium-dependent protein kinase
MGAACGVQKKTRRVGDEFQANLIHEHKTTELLTDTYELGKSLGKGSYGVVHLGRHKKTKRRVAIKTIKVGNGETWKELKNEVNIMKNLRHPNVVQLYETFSTNDTLFLIMAECAGGDLTGWLKNIMKTQGKLCTPAYETKCARIMVKTLSALAYMHDRKICHRDLKLDNLMFENSNEDAEIIVMDFGLGEIIQGKAKLEDASGTLPYMSPEVLDESIPYDYPCDVWAAGVILHVLLVKDLPFRGGNIDAVQADIRHKLRSPVDYMFNNPVWDSVSEDAKDMVVALLTADHKKRPTAEQAQQHKWLRTHEDPKQKLMSFKRQQTTEIAEALRDFGSFEKLKQSALIAAAFSLDESTVSGLRDAFNSIDTANNGRITKDELSKVGSVCVRCDGMSY